jgi:hypothetical protein
VSRVYRISNPCGTEYVGTAREADRCKPGGDEPDSTVAVDAAAECNRLVRYLDETEARLGRVRWMLQELLEACPPQTVAETAIGRRVQQYVADNPMPRADAAHRDGERSYGGG